MKTKEQKKKERERESREKVLKRREATRAKAKEERKDTLEKLRVQKITNRAEGRTYVNRDPDDQHQMLQRNMAILEALDEEAKVREQQQPSPPKHRDGGSGVGRIGAEVAFYPKKEPSEKPVFFEADTMWTSSMITVKKKLKPDATVSFDPKN